jgi:menaquinol-cytochrome c reductase iron-sulfur subunit
MNPAAPDHSHAPQTAPPMSRRNMFLFGAGSVLNVIGVAMLGIPLVGFVFSSFFRKNISKDWITLGKLDDFPPEQTRLAVYRNPFTRPWDGETADIPCYVRRLPGDQFKVFAVNCTHLGCPVRWFEESELFMCPCHGGVFYSDGSRASGPPPRGLFEYQYKVENGLIQIKGGYLPTLNNPM